MSVIVNYGQDINNAILAYTGSYTKNEKLCMSRCELRPFLVVHTSPYCLYDIDYLVGALP